MGNHNVLLNEFSREEAHIIKMLKLILKKKTKNKKKTNKQTPKIVV